MRVRWKSRDFAPRVAVERRRVRESRPDARQQIAIAVEGVRRDAGAYVPHEPLREVRGYVRHCPRGRGVSRRPIDERGKAGCLKSQALCRDGTPGKGAGEKFGHVRERDRAAARRSRANAKRKGAERFGVVAQLERGDEFRKPPFGLAAVRFARRSSVAPPVDRPTRFPDSPAQNQRTRALSAVSFHVSGPSVFAFALLLLSFRRGNCFPRLSPE